MNYITGKTSFGVMAPSAVSLGKFDGLHRGHQKLLQHILEQKKNGLEATIFTFASNPTRMLSGLSAQNILTNEERREMLAKAGVDNLLECPFVPEIAHMEPERFIEEVGGTAENEVCSCGNRFSFWISAARDHAMLQKLAPKYGYTVEVVEKEQSHGRDISSTYIREALHDGNVKLANELLGYRYYVSGIVLHGRQIGRTIGMPTTNLLPPQEKLLPKDGVYLTRTFVKEDEYYGITNVGYKPTVGGETRRGVETYLFDFDGDLYGQDLMVEFIEFRRPEQTFQSLDELKAHILSDMNWGKSVARQI
ncbi:MAG: riboflavin biosynthesis protein RibF [Clostridia bacterium]